MFKDVQGHLKVNSKPSFLGTNLPGNSHKQPRVGVPLNSRGTFFAFGFAARLLPIGVQNHSPNFEFPWKFHISCTLMYSLHTPETKTPKIGCACFEVVHLG